MVRSLRYPRVRSERFVCMLAEPKHICKGQGEVWETCVQELRGTLRNTPDASHQLAPYEAV